MITSVLLSVQVLQCRIGIETTTILSIIHVYLPDYEIQRHNIDYMMMVLTRNSHKPKKSTQTTESETWFIKKDPENYIQAENF